jgi:hypothetical protein
MLMGAWGEGVFENDTAGDWTDQFEESAPPSIVSAAIVEVLDCDDPGADACSAALAAAEVIAASRGHAARGLPDEIKDWLAKTKFQADDELARQAREAVVRIAECSELRQLFENASTWRRGLENLQHRLQSPAKPARYRVSNVSLNNGIRAARKMVSDFRGRLSVERSGYTSLILPDDLSDEKLIGLLQQHAEALSGMRELVVGCKKVTDRALEEFYRLPHLARLYLDCTQITDAGVPHLRKLAGLRDLSLARTAVTDAGLLALVGTQLCCVAVNESKITPAGVEQFQKAMSGCFVGPCWEWKRDLLAPNDIFYWKPNVGVLRR